MTGINDWASITDLENLFYGGGSAEKIALLRRAADEGITLADILNQTIPGGGTRGFEVIYFGNDVNTPRTPGIVGGVIWAGDGDPVNKQNLDIILGVDTGVPAAPTNIIILSDDTTLEFLWTESIAPDLESTLIYQDGALYETVPAGIETIVLEGLNNGERHDWQLASKDDSGNISPLTTIRIMAASLLPYTTNIRWHFRPDSYSLLHNETFEVMEDLGPNGFDVTSDCALDPFYVQDGCNGIPGIGFVASTDNVTGTGTRLTRDTPDVTTDTSVFMIVKIQKNGGCPVLATANTNTNPTFQVDRVSSSVPWRLATTGLAADITTGGTNTNGVTALVEVHSGPTGTRFYLNGTLIDTVVGANMAGKTALKYEVLKWGATRTATFGGSTMTLGEAVAYEDEIPTLNKTAVRAYFSSKYNLGI